MSVEQPNQVDIVSEDREGRIVLTISDHLDWQNEPFHAKLLRDKVETYLTFVTSGQILEQFPEATGREIVIDLMFHYQLVPRAKPLVAELGSAVERSGCRFRYRVVSATPYDI